GVAAHPLRGGEDLPRRAGVGLDSAEAHLRADPRGGIEAAAADLAAARLENGMKAVPPPRKQPESAYAPSRLRRPGLGRHQKPRLQVFGLGNTDQRRMIPRRAPPLEK